MAGVSKLKLAVDSGSWDAGLRKATSSLNAFIDDAGGLDKAMQKDAQSLQKFVGMMGNMQTTSNTAKGKVKELTVAFEDLSHKYNNLSAQEKQSPIGIAMSQTMEKLKSRIHETREEINKLNQDIGNVKPVDVGSSDLGGLGSLSDFTKMGLGGLTKIASQFGLAVGGVQLFTSAIKGNIETAKNFETSISKLSSITGMAGEDLNKLKQYAIDLGGSTTQSASQVAEAFMLIGSQKPELLKNQEALRDTTNAAITLGEAASIDVTEAARALTASLNIMGEGADQANRYINVLAAGSKEGAVDINGLTEIVFKSGQAAKMNKMSFEELIAVAESIGPSFGSASEAGTALNAMLLKLETQTNNNFKPSVVGLDTALKNLKEANLSAAETAKMVTETGMKALVPLLQNVDGVKDLKEAITGTNTAEEQSNTNTNNLSGSLASLDSAWEKFNLTLNDSNGGLKTLVDWLASAVNWMADMAKHTTIAEQAVRKFNEANGINSDNKNDYQKEETSEDQKKEFHNRANQYRNEILAKQKELLSAEAAARRSPANAQAQYGHIETLKKQIQALKEEEASFIKGGVSFFGGKSLNTNKGNADTPTTQKTPKPATTETTTPAVGSIDEMQAKVKELNKQFNATADQSVRDNLKAQIDECNKQLDVMRGKFDKLGKDEQATFTMQLNAEQLAELEKILPNDGVVKETVDVTQTGDIIDTSDAVKNITAEVKQTGDIIDTSDAVKQITADVKQTGDIIDTSDAIKNITAEVKQTGDIIDTSDAVKNINANVKQTGDVIDTSDEVKTITLNVDTQEGYEALQKFAAQHQDIDVSMLIKPKVDDAELKKEQKRIEDELKKSADITLKFRAEVDTITTGKTSIGDQYTKKQGGGGQEKEFDNLVRQYDQLSAAIEKAKADNDGAIVDPEAIIEAENELDNLRAKIDEIGPAIEANMQFDSMMQGIQSVQNFASTIGSTVSSIESLSNAWNEADTDSEKFAATIQTITTSLSVFQQVMQAVNAIQKLFNGLTAVGTTVKKGEAMATQQDASAKIQDASAAGVDAAAQQSDAAAASGNAIAKSGEAIAGATSAGASLPFPANIAAIAAGVAAVVAVIATIASTSKQAKVEYHAQGGIVGMDSFIPRGTDTVPTMLTPGELILNYAQQSNIAGALESKSEGGGGLNAQPYVTGEVMYLGLKNYLRQNGMGDLVTTG